MKRTVSIILICIFLFTMNGCGTGSDGAQEAAQSGQPDQAGMGSADGAFANGRGNMVFGRVKSITGNEVVLELGEAAGGQLPDQTLPEGVEGTDMPQADGQPDDGAATERRQPPEGANGENMPERPAMDSSDGQTRPQGGGSGQRSGGGSMRNVEITYTGETATYLIPVGLSVGSGDYTSIKAGMVLRLTLNEAEEIVSVSVVSQ